MRLTAIEMTSHIALTKEWALDYKKIMNTFRISKFNVIQVFV
jgi:hypothetical protein